MIITKSLCKSKILLEAIKGALDNLPRPKSEDWSSTVFLVYFVNEIQDFSLPHEFIGR